MKILYKLFLKLRFYLLWLQQIPIKLKPEKSILPLDTGNDPFVTNRLQKSRCTLIHDH